MKNIAVLGRGKIGQVVCELLSDKTGYKVFSVDSKKDELVESSTYTLINLDVKNHAQMAQFIKENQPDALVSCLPYYLNTLVASYAKEFDLHYFDLTEDVETTKNVRNTATGSSKAFVPQCGLAPGFINIVSKSLIDLFDEIDHVKLRVGALPVSPGNNLKYCLTWSTDGLINQYGNSCPALVNGELVDAAALEGLEDLSIDGQSYECFNTSGGVGTLAETYQKKVKNLSYKTIRYPGHCDIMKLLMHDLGFNNDRENLKKIFERSIPTTDQDIVLIYVTVVGKINQQLVEKTYIKKIYNRNINGKHYSAIQQTTASGLCAVIDKVFDTPQLYQGYCRQEDFSLEDVLRSEFGTCYRSDQQ